MRAHAWFLLAALTACGDDRTKAVKWTSVDHEGKNVERIVIDMEDGDLKLSSAPDATVSISVAAGRSYTHDLRDKTFRIRLKTAAVVRAPPGVDLVVTSSKGSVQLNGSWRSVTVLAKSGSIHADMTAVAGGKLVARGDIAFQAQSAPSTDLTCESQGGNVDLRIPKAFRGTLSLHSGAGRILAKRHARMLLRHDGTDRNVTGFVGPRPKRDESVPGVWARALRGEVAFELVN